MTADPDVKRARRNGWLRTVAVAGVAAIGQLVQVLRSDAETNRINTTVSERLTSIDNRLDGMSYENRHMSERITVLEAKK